MPLLFLDRDGTLMDDVGYPRDPSDVFLIPGAAEAIRMLVELRYVPAVVSNQSGIGRGIISTAQAEAVHERFVALFEQASDIRLPCFYCPHAPEEYCDCRKPRPGLLMMAALRLGLPIDEHSIMIGDKPSDVDAGVGAGCGQNFLFRANWDAILEAVRDHLRSQS